MTDIPTITYSIPDYDPGKDERICGCGCGRRVCDIWKEGMDKSAEAIAAMIDSELVRKWELHDD